MQKITSHLWFDTEAKEAAEFYISIFPNSKIKTTAKLENTPSGSVDMLTIELAGQEFSLISAGPLFKFNPSVSYVVTCKTTEEVDELWAKLFEGGSALMELREYPFCKRYGWLQDKFGLSWQLMFTEENEVQQKITPSLLFVGDVCGKTEEAINLYTSIFPNSKIGTMNRYPAGRDPDKEGTIMQATFTLAGQDFTAMDSAHNHKFKFNEAISFIVHCETQEEIDKYWEKLSADPAAEQCGWLKDKFGLSWQIVPTVMDEMLSSGNKEKIARVTEAFLKMKKFDIAELEKAYEGN